MITFTKITIQGFGSIVEPLCLEFNSRGIHIIRGENGVGKSTIFQALCWVLFGKLIKKNSTIEPWKSIVGHYEGTLVEICFTKGDDAYVVARCLNYKKTVHGLAGKNNAYLWINGELQTKEKGANNIHREVSRIIGYSFELFKNSVVFPQESIRLMEESGPSKKEIFEEAFDAFFITKAAELVEKERAKFLEELTKLELELPHHENRQVDLKNTLKDIENQAVNFYTERDKQILAIRKKIKGLKALKNSDVSIKAKDIQRQYELVQSEIDRVQARKDLYEGVLDREFKLQMELTGLQAEAQSHENEIKGLRLELLQPKRTCPTCNRPMEFDKPKMLLKIKDLTNELKALNTRITTLSVKHTLVQKKVAKRGKATMELAEKKSLKVSLEKQLTSLKDALEAANNASMQIKLLKAQKNELSAQVFKMPQERIEDLQRQITLESNIITESTDRINTLRYMVDLRNWALKEPLSNKGIKAYLFKIMLNKVNLHLKSYYSFIGFNIECYVDMESANKNIEMLITFREQLASYYDLSKGQKQLANIVAIFALSDTLRENKPCNILLLDEIFESLSENNVEVVSNIIQHKAKDRSVYIISHLSTFQPTNSKLINLVLDEKFQTKLA